MLFHLRIIIFRVYFLVKNDSIMKRKRKSFFRFLESSPLHFCCFALCCFHISLSPSSRNPTSLQCLERGIFLANLMASHYIYQGWTGDRNQDVTFYPVVARLFHNFRDILVRQMRSGRQDDIVCPTPASYYQQRNIFHKQSSRVLSSAVSAQNNMRLP